MKPQLICILLLFFGGTVTAQNPIAQLKFEDAEKAFNAGNYAKALEYIEETEGLVGTTSKTLYLKIVSQDKLLESDVRQNIGLLGQLRANTQKYLKALENEEIDDKYRAVYEISKKLANYPTDEAGLERLGKQNPALAASGNTSVAAVLKAYQQAVVGNQGLSAITSIQTEAEMYQNGQLFSRLTEKKGIGKYYMENVSNGVRSTAVYHKALGKGYMQVLDKQMPMDERILANYEKITADGFHLLALGFDNVDFTNATVKEGVFEGKSATVVALTDHSFYFDRNSHLLLGMEMRIAGEMPYVLMQKYQDYKVVNGIQFPFTLITKNHFIQQGNAAMQEQALVKQVAAIGLVGKKDKKKLAEHVAETPALADSENLIKFTSIVVNEPIPDDLFD